MNANMITMVKTGTSKVPLDRVPARLLRLVLEQTVGDTVARAIVVILGAPPERLVRWLDGMENAMRHLDDIEAWVARAQAMMTQLSGRTPPALRRVLMGWPLVSAPMAEALTGARRAAVQRNLAWMQQQGLIYEITGQGQFRMWRTSP